MLIPGCFRLSFFVAGAVFGEPVFPFPARVVVQSSTGKYVPASFLVQSSTGEYVSASFVVQSSTGKYVPASFVVQSSTGKYVSASFEVVLASGIFHAQPQGCHRQTHSLGGVFEEGVQVRGPAGPCKTERYKRPSKGGQQHNHVPILFWMRCYQTWLNS